MKIDTIEAIPVTIPIEAPILTCYGSLGAIRGRSSGLPPTTGWSAIAKWRRATRPSLPDVRRVFRGSAPWESTPPHPARSRHWNYYPFQKPEPLMAAIEIALLDIAARRWASRSIGCSAARCTTGSGRLLPVLPPRQRRGEGRDPHADEAVAFARQQVRLRLLGDQAEGRLFRPETDRDTLAALRDTFGKDMKLRVDPQGCWTPVTAIRIGRELDALGLEYYEDPVLNAAAMAQVRKSVTTPLATNMCVTQFEEFFPAISMGAIDMVLTDIWYWGGMRATMAVDRMCDATGIDLGMHSGGRARHRLGGDDPCGGGHAAS